jgi:NADPH:quinone reductase-like Zn-dependent oxidoreductase
MRAMRASGFKGYADLELVNLPNPEVSNGKVLVRMTGAGVTPLDHTILSGQYPKAKAPLILGNEGAGVVEEGGALVAEHTGPPHQHTGAAGPENVSLPGSVRSRRIVVLMRPMGRNFRLTDVEGKVVKPLLA